MPCLFTQISFLQFTNVMPMRWCVRVCACGDKKPMYCMLDGLLVTGTRVSGADANEESAAV